MSQERADGVVCGTGTVGTGTVRDVGSASLPLDPQARTARAIIRLRESAEHFVLMLRREEGFDLEALDELCEAIDRCGRCWAHSDTVPKSAAQTLSELFPAIEACAWLYPEPTRQRISEAAVRGAQSVSAGLDSAEGGPSEL